MFLEYIVEQGHLTKEQALKAVMEQMESMPSLVRVLLESEKRSSDQLYDLLIEGAKKNCSFFEMLKMKNILSEEELIDFLNKQNLQSKSLGDIFIQSGLLKREQYDQILRDYASVKETYESKLEKAAPVSEAPAVSVAKEEPEAPANEEKVESVTPPSGGGGISAAALESLMAVQDVDPELLAQLEGQTGASEDTSQEEVQENSQENPQENQEDSGSSNHQGHSEEAGGPALSEYLDFYDDSLQSELFVTANRFRLKGKKRDLESLYEYIVKILSLVKINEFSFQVKLLEPYGNMMSHLLNSDSEEPEDWRQCPSDMLELLWEFRKCIAEGRGEAQLLAKAEYKEMYLKNLKTVMSYMKRSA